jgi:predicted small secreted protein
MKHQGIHLIAVRLVPLIGLVAFTAFLGACNTMHGLGKDVERGGEHMEDAATKVQKKM